MASFKASLRIFWLVVLLGASAAARAAPPDSYRFHDLTAAFDRARAEAKPLFLYFGRYGCSTCRKMHAEVFSDAALNRQYHADFVLAYVDTESGNRIRLPSGERTTEMQFAARSRVLGTPPFVYFSPELEPLFRRTGLQTVAQMRGAGEFVAGGHYRSQTLQEYLAAR